MDVAAALKELTGLNAEIRRAAFVDVDGSTLAATQGVDGAALGRNALALLATARSVRPAGPQVARVSVSLESASVIAVREGDRVAVAITGPEPVLGLLAHDLRTCLRRVGAAPVRRRVRTKAANAGA